MRFPYLLFACLIILSACQATPSPQQASRPNILYIMADDHSSQAFGVYGHELDPYVRRSQFQRLAQEGMRLDRVYCTNSICVPSRAAILTGQYSHLNQVYTLSDALDTSRTHIGHLLQTAGYQTAIVGKWHLKTEPQGFDYYNVLPGQGRYQRPILKEKGRAWSEKGQEYEGFSSDVIADEALQWLGGRNQQEPFFLMCHFKAVHEPFDFAARYQTLYENDTLPLPESLFEDRSHRSEGSRDKGIFMQDLLGRYLARPDFYPQPPLDTTGLNQRQKIEATCQKLRKDYLRGVAGLNDNLGRILDYLDENGLAENTIVVYTSDQGYFLGEHGYMDKRWMFEESARMPMLIRYPKGIEAGTTNDDLLLNVDFAPSFLDWAGVEVPSELQGRSFRTNLEGQKATDWRTAFYYRYWMQERRPAHFGVRDERYKLIFYYGLPLDRVSGVERSPAGWELYDLEADPDEEQNIYDDPSMATVVERLKEELLRLREEMGDTDEAYPELLQLIEKHW
ncbi:MAG: sulfatase [Bacteroidia bacterium]